MAKSGSRDKRKKAKQSSHEDPLVPSLVEIKKDKHRSCESRRRQQETNAIENLRGLLVQSKKYKFDKNVKLDRLQILGSSLTYIQEHISTLNILMGVLCNAVANSVDVENQLVSISNQYGIVSRDELLQLFNVPETNEEFMDQLCTTQLQEQEQQLATPMTIPYEEEKDPISFSFK